MSQQSFVLLPGPPAYSGEVIPGHRLQQVWLTEDGPLLRLGALYWAVEGVGCVTHLPNPELAKPRKERVRGHTNSVSPRKDVRRFSTEEAALNYIKVNNIYT